MQWISSPFLSMILVTCCLQCLVVVLLPPLKLRKYIYKPSNIDNRGGQSSILKMHWLFWFVLLADEWSKWSTGILGDLWPSTFNSTFVISSFVKTATGQFWIITTSFPFAPVCIVHKCCLILTTDLWQIMQVLLIFFTTLVCLYDGSRVICIIGLSMLCFFRAKMPWKILDNHEIKHTFYPTMSFSSCSQHICNFIICEFHCVLSYFHF